MHDVVMHRLVIACFDAGGGHRAAARALAEAIRRERRPWHVEVLNVDEVLEPVDPVHRVTGVRGGDLYNWTLRRGWTAGSAQVIPMMHGMIRLLHSRQVRILRRCWRTLQPDLVLSVIPHFNRALYQSLQEEAAGKPFVTLVTDFADYPPHFWFEPQDQHFICGSELAVHQAESTGADPRSIWRVSGMILHPSFYEPIHGDRAAERQRLGLNPDLPTGLVLFGGYGSQTMIEIARRMAEANSRAQLVFLCGRNQRLSAELRALKLPYAVHVQDFTDNVAYFMWLSDFFIGKPGPGSVSEALAMRLPVIVQDDLRTLAQERYNVQWIREQGVGIPVRRIKSLPQAVDDLLEQSTYREMAGRIEALNNRAVFEVPQVLQRIFMEHSAPSHARFA
jgi:UDP-N-acetylglucosamine:LPS N-acetylglucosamine transferase